MHLSKRYQVWEAASRRAGIPVDDRLMESLRNAKSLLDDEVAKLQERDNHTCQCWAKTKRTLFPAQLGLSFERVIASFDEIPALLQEEEVAATAFSQRLLRTPFSFIVRDDNRFVPLERTERAVQVALDSPQGQVVVLYGGPGRGKSTLARHISLLYKAKIDGKRFDHVFFLECGRDADVSLKQFELLDGLGGMANELQGEQAPSSAASKIRRLLVAQLKHAEILIILDDVWEADFLVRIVELCGIGVKLLVTSQSPNLSSEITNAVAIRMEDILLEDARKILASHAGLPDQRIRLDLQDLADKMIQETGSNPLALASVANAILSVDASNPEAWNDAYKGLFLLLEREDPKVMFGAPYRKSFWSSMKLSLNSLRDEKARDLLILASMCKGPLISEDVIQLLYGRTRFGGDPSLFRFLSNHLVRAEWLQISPGSGTTTSASWSVHGLRKQFIVTEMRGRILEILASLDDKSHMSNVEPRTQYPIYNSEKGAIVLRALSVWYFDKVFVEHMHTSNILSPLENFNDVKRNAIEPIIGLLRRPMVESWTAKEQHFAIQVFLQYIHHGMMDDNGVAHLFALPSAALAIFEFVKRAALIAESSFLYENRHGLMKALVELMKDEGDQTMQRLAFKTVQFLAYPVYHQTFIISFPGLLDAVLQQVVNNCNKEVMIAALQALANLARDGGHWKEKILNHEGALAGLIHCMSRDRDVDVQKRATWALKNLACAGEDGKEKILNHEGALAGLIQCMSRDRDVSVQKQATGALLNLASGEDDGKEKILNHEGALAGLIQCMSRDRDVDVQKHATWALKNLACAGEEGIAKILNHEEALAGLIQCMSRDRDVDVQKHATWALKNLACAGEEGIAKILNHEGALVGLIQCISRDRDVDVQKQATCVFVNSLACAEEEGKEKILNHEGALAGLIQCMSRDRDVDVQKCATWALKNLAWAREDMKEKILNHEGALAGFIQCMWRDRDIDVQKNAIWALKNLACAGEDKKEKILNHEGALVGLIQCMSRDRDADVQKHATLTFIKLSSGGEDGKEKILNHEGTVASLIECMSRDRDVGVQKHATRALINLASAGEDGKDKILNHKGALAGLIQCMSRDRDVEVQKYATSALKNLACAREDGKEKILNHEGALVSLIPCMSRDRDVDVQKNATWALKNLVCAGEGWKEKILNHEGALASFIQCMSRDRDVGVQKWATRALKNLACAGEDGKEKILNHKGALASLIQCMSRVRDMNLQKYATWALKNLAWAREGGKEKILNHKGALTGLIQCISRDRDMDVQKYATWALKNLVCAREDGKKEILNHDGALAGLIQCMSSDRDVDVQKHATWALKNLACAGEDGIEKILNHEGALTGLIQCMSRDRDVDVQKHSTLAFINLSSGGEDGKEKILNYEGALVGLIECMSRDRDVDVQKQATWALINLASSGEHGKEKLLNHEETLAGLIECMSRDRDVDVQRHSTWALKNLACGGEDGKERILNHGGALMNLIQCMSRDRDVEVQNHATWAFINLAWGGEHGKMKILNHEGALAGVIECMWRDRDVSVQLHATWALKNLACAGDDGKEKILNQEGALMALIQCMSRDRDVEVQRSAVFTLHNLAILVEARTMIKSIEGSIKGLLNLLCEHVSEEAQESAAAGLTLIDYARGNEATLHSTSAYAGRAKSKLCLGMYIEALADLDTALATFDGTKELQTRLLSFRCFAKAKLNDFQGAMVDADNYIEAGFNLAFGWQERGVLKRMSGDLYGALADFNESLQLAGGEDYEVLKHRGYVRFLLMDEEGACADAEWAQRIKPRRVDLALKSWRSLCLGGTSVEYMDYILR